MQKLRTALYATEESCRQNTQRQQLEMDALQERHRRQSVVWSDEKRSIRKLGAVRTELLRSSHKKQVSGRGYGVTAWWVCVTGKMVIMIEGNANKIGVQTRKYTSVHV